MPLIRKPAPGGGASQPEADPSATLAQLQQGSDEERWAAARRAAALPDAAAVLGRALGKERDARVRGAMLTTLAAIGTPEAVEAVLPLLRSDDAQARTEALDALQLMKEAMAARLPALLADPDADVRLLACELARGLPNGEAAVLLAQLLDRETEANVCAAAVEVLAEVGDARVLPALERCLARFQGNPFLAFSIQAAADRLRAQPSPRG